MSPKRGIRDFFRSFFSRYEAPRSEILGRVRERRFIDPVCGMKVDPHGRFETAYGGVTYRFCSAHCLHQFKADPRQYGRPAA